MAYAIYLLDTHALIWFETNNQHVPSSVIDIVSDRNSFKYFSQISLFEIAIKQKLGKLPILGLSIQEFYNRTIENGFEYLPLTNQHIYAHNDIPLKENHRDPFDRLLLAAALHEKATILSGDEKLKQYNDVVNVLW